MNENEISEADFTAYEEVRVRGKYNMFDPKAQRATGLDEETYLNVMTNYSALSVKYPQVKVQANISRFR